MPPRNAFKSNSSFFRMVAVGAVGAQAVRDDLDKRGHKVVELERGALTTRIWRDVKRKRVRIPDLVCVRCGVRIESRAKTSADLSMSHSPSDAERAWNYGMLDTDWIAFPILHAEESLWSAGALDTSRSLWRERSLISWRLVGRINIFTVAAFRTKAPRQLRAKGVTEGSEVQVQWKARFAPASGKVTGVGEKRIDYVIDTASHQARHFRVAEGGSACLASGASFEENQVVAGQVCPLTSDESRCPAGYSHEALERMLRSRERTVRFTGCKLARLAKDAELCDLVRELARDPQEDAYVRMEAKAYLCEVRGDSADDHFRSILLEDTDDQMRLEAAVALAETRTQSAFDLLRKVLEDQRQPLFLRSACAWGIGCHGTEAAADCLVRAFADVAPEMREQALIALQDLGSAALTPLLKGLTEESGDVAAGAAEALRRIADIPAEKVVALAKVSRSTWPTWTLAHLPKSSVAPHIASLQGERPEVHYALSVLWTFLESWIAEDWTPRSTP